MEIFEILTETRTWLPSSPHSKLYGWICGERSLRDLKKKQENARLSLTMGPVCTRQRCKKLAIEAGFGPRFP